MKFNRILMGSVATAALAGAIALAAPANAQSSLNPPQYSSPQERAQTQQLNEQNLNGTNQSPAQLNGETTNDNDSASQPDYYSGSEQPPYGSEQSQYYNEQQPNDENSGYNNGYAPMPNNPNQYSSPQPAPGYGAPDSGPYAQQNDQQQQYQQQMQQYQDQQQNYQDQRAQYQNENDRYRHNLRWYDQSRWAYDYPHPYAYEYDRPRLERLYLMAEPSQQLSNVPIEGRNGVWVGRVRNIETGPDGRPARVEVALNRRVSVWVNPSDLRFDPDERIVYTDLSRGDLWQMPGATVESGPL